MHGLQRQWRQKLVERAPSGWFSSTWKLVPPNPNALTPTRRGAPSGHASQRWSEREANLSKGTSERAFSKFIEGIRPIVERQRSLDATGGTRCRLEVSNVRLDRTNANRTPGP